MPSLWVVGILRHPSKCLTVLQGSLGNAPGLPYLNIGTVGLYVNKVDILLLNQMISISKKQRYMA